MPTKPGAYRAIYAHEVLVVLKSTAPGVQRSMWVPFAEPVKPPAGMPFNSDSDMAVPVTFTPTKKGTFTTPYQLTWTDVNGTHTLTVTLTGTAV